MTIKEVWETRRKFCIEAGVKYGRESWEYASDDTKKDFSIWAQTVLILVELRNE